MKSHKLGSFLINAGICIVIVLMLLKVSSVSLKYEFKENSHFIENYWFYIKVVGITMTYFILPFVIDIIKKKHPGRLASVDGIVITAYVIMSFIYFIFVFAEKFTEFGLTDNFYPGSPPVHDMFTSVYFATITWSTVGYGDVTPGTIECRWWARNLSILGVFQQTALIAIVVATFKDPTTQES
ncbi:MAG TPA: ion channel [Xanthobacteraceae bacterium]|nr:ion channel [Xanthobacteraceae bacterium]